MINPVVKSNHREIKQMSKILFVVTLCLAAVACGGQATRPLPQNTPTPRSSPMPTPSPISSSEVFQNVPQTWAFQSQCQNRQQDGSLGPWIIAHSWVNVMPQPDTLDVDGVTVIHNTIWHYTKDQPCAYWMPNSVFYEDPTKPLTELYFFLSTDATYATTGAWYSTGGHIIAPNGFPWDTTVPRPAQDFVYQVGVAPAGMPKPYLILANSGIRLDTEFEDEGSATSRWSTYMSVDAQNRLVSDQYEGVRGHETWHFCMGAGMCYVEVLNQGQLTNVDPRLNLIRIN
jgi:hypothetical protein